jgi:hypothetical protein
MSRQPRTFLPLPPGFDPLDATCAEVASYRRESLRTVYEKVQNGTYKSYLDGRIRKILFDSVKVDRLAAIERSQKPPPAGKRRVGRPRGGANGGAPTPA